jgi:hypothetical protein
MSWGMVSWPRTTSSLGVLEVTVRIAVAATPLAATLDEAVPAAIGAIEEAGRLGAQVVCLPETGIPGGSTWRHECASPGQWRAPWSLDRSGPMSPQPVPPQLTRWRRPE